MASDVDRRDLLTTSLQAIQHHERLRLRTFLQELTATVEAAASSCAQADSAPQDSLTADIARLEALGEGVISEVERVAGELYTEQCSAAAEYAIAATEVLLAHRPLIIESCVTVKKSPYVRVLFAPALQKLQARHIVQQVFFICKNVQNARNLLKELQEEYQRLDFQERTEAHEALVKRVEAALHELPRSTAVKLLCVESSSGGSQEPCNLLLKATYELLTISIAVYCNLSDFTAAYQWRFLANEALFKCSSSESRWYVDVDKMYIGAKWEEVLSMAVAQNTEQAYHRALEFWYTLEPNGLSAQQLQIALGDYYYTAKDESRALIAYRKAERIIDMRQMPHAELVIMYLRLAQLLKSHSYPAAAQIKCLTDALNICERFPAGKSTLIDVLYSLALVYSDINALQKAEKAFQSCLSLMEEADSQYKKLAGVYYHFAVLQVKTQNYPIAESYFHQALTADSHLINNFSIYEVYSSLANMYRDWKKPKDCEFTHIRAYKCAFAHSDKRQIAEWGKKLIAYYQSTCARNREETMAAVTYRDATGQYQYGQWECRRTIRSLYVSR